MKNTCPPTLAPRPSRSASKGKDLDAFDDNVDRHAAFGATPVPNDMPTHPTLYNGLLAFGSIEESKHLRIHPLSQHYP